MIWIKTSTYAHGLLIYIWNEGYLRKSEKERKEGEKERKEKEGERKGERESFEQRFKVILVLYKYY